MHVYYIMIKSSQKFWVVYVHYRFIPEQCGTHCALLKLFFTRTPLACIKGRITNFYFSFGKMKLSVLGLVLVFGLTCVQSSNLEIPSPRKESELVTILL